jgi:nucleoside-diphosphate-sugar epimerase
MEIVGRGFLARHLARIAGRHPGVVAVAAGVSAASGTSADQFRREAELLETVLRRCQAGGERLLFFSTASTGMYGAPGGCGREDEPIEPRTPYGRHKLALEDRLRESGAGHLVLRLAHVAGPDQPPHQLLPSLASQVLAGTVRVHRGARRDVIDVDDVVAVIDRLLAAGVDREVVNVATGYAVPVEDIVAGVEARLGVRAARQVIDTPPVNHLVSIEKLHRLVPAVGAMGFGPTYYERVLDRYVPAAALV